MKARLFMAAITCMTMTAPNILAAPIQLDTQTLAVAEENKETVSTTNEFPKVSFEEEEDYSIVKAEEGSTMEVIKFGAKDGTRSLSTQVTYGSNQESSGIVLDGEGTWDFGENSTLFVDFYNTTNSKTQLRIDVTDINGETRTNYYNVDAWVQKRCAMSNFGPAGQETSKNDGWWGAEKGLDIHNIDKIKIYLWGNGAEKFLVDNIRVASPKSSTFEKISFEDGEVPEYAYESNAKATIVSNGSTDGKNAMKVDFEAGGFPTVRLLPEENFNWGVGTCLSFDVTNPTDTVNTVYVKVVDGSGAETVGSLAVPGKTTKSTFMTFNTRAMYLGMRFFPNTDGKSRISYSWGAKGIDVSDIKEVSFFLYTPSQKSTLIFDNIEVLPDPASSMDYLTGIVDKYGQYSERDWETKIHSDAELKQSVSNEKAWMEANPQDTTSRSQYGGWSAGPKLKATGKFRTEKYDGKWTLVDPEGYIYFATGLDILRFDDMKTWITGRENMFLSQPPKDSHYASINSAAVPPLGLMSGHTYNFYTANLEKKYGSGYTSAWRDMTFERMKNWGFTSLGNWSDPATFWSTAPKNKMPFVADCWIRGNFPVIDDGMSPGLLVPDAFDPSFEQAAKGAINSLQGSSLNTNPWCIGAYINNEISWGNPLGDSYSIVATAMNKDAASSAAKKAFMGYLKGKYVNIAALNKAWDTNYASFEAMNASNILPKTRTEALTADLSEMLYMLATKYYKTVNDYFHEMYPDTLNLGSRLAEWGCPKEVERACAENVDVLSYNCYKESVNTEGAWMHAEELDVPTIIGEFHFGASDERMFSPGLIAASSQKERGEMYESYITDLLKSSTFVGGHWFQYIDQPITGRSWDGENYNAGFVDVCDVPYYPLVESAKNIHSNMYNIKYGKVSETKISVTPEVTIDASKNQTAQLEAVVTTDSADKSVIWSSSDEKIATVDQKGVVTAVGNGKVDIIATAKANQSVKAICKVEVMNKEVVAPEPPVVEPPVVEPPVTPEPPVVEPPVDPEPPVVEPPVDPEPPVVEPPVTPEPPVVEPPVDPEPPVVDPETPDVEETKAVKSTFNHGWSGITDAIGGNVAVVANEDVKISDLSFRYYFTKEGEDDQEQIAQIHSVQANLRRAPSLIDLNKDFTYKICKAEGNEYYLEIIIHNDTVLHEGEQVGLCLMIKKADNSKYDATDDRGFVVLKK